MTHTTQSMPNIFHLVFGRARWKTASANWQQSCADLAGSFGAMKRVNACPISIVYQRRLKRLRNCPRRHARLGWLTSVPRPVPCVHPRRGLGCYASTAARAPEVMVIGCIGIGALQIVRFHVRRTSPRTSPAARRGLLLPRIAACDHQAEDAEACVPRPKARSSRFRIPLSL